MRKKKTHASDDGIRDGEALLERELRGLDNVMRVERRSYGAVRGGLAAGELLDPVEVDAEDARAVIGEERGERAADDFAPGEQGRKAGVEHFFLRDNRAGKQTDLLTTVIVLPNARLP